MARGQKYNDDIKEKAYALLATNNSVSYVAEQLGLPRSTVKTWKEQYDAKAEESGEATLAKLRQKKKEEFVNRAWGIIGQTQTILERRLQRAIESEDKLDELLEEICELDYKTLTDAQRKALYAKLSVIKVDDVKALGVVLGTVYDKQALANKEATGIVDGEFRIKKFEDF